ncbi:MAG: glycogen/starch/alpha-glucan phosphorylase, partial [Bacilli bacterium]
MAINYKELQQRFISKIESQFGKSIEYSSDQEKYLVLASLIKEYAGHNWKETKSLTIENNQKTLYYFSMEFLMGRLLTNNLMNLGVYKEIKEALAQIDIDIENLEIQEEDAGLGNGGLGRLAACFMDSLASLAYPGNGISIRYQYGFFKQKIEKFEQIEHVDP